MSIEIKASDLPLEANMRVHKQYFIQYESDKMICGSNVHTDGNASTINSAKSIIRKLRKMLSDENPRNFRVYDCWADVDENTNFVPCVYSED